MARLPCTVGGHYTPRKNRLAYVHVWGSGTAWNTRVRLCPAHAPAIQEDLAQFKWDPADLTLGADSAPTHCVSCLEPVDESGFHVSVTYYPSDDEREDYWGRLHIEHELPPYLANGESLA